MGAISSIASGFLIGTKRTKELTIDCNHINGFTFENQMALRTSLTKNRITLKHFADGSIFHEAHEGFESRDSEILLIDVFVKMEMVP